MSSVNTENKVRRATPKDFDDNRSFAIVSVNVDATDYFWYSSRQPSKLTKHQRNGEIRLSCYGCIEWFSLGTYLPQSSDTFQSSGVFIDYFENVEQLEQKAQAYLEEARLRHIALHEKEIKRLRAIEVSKVSRSY